MIGFTCAGCGRSFTVPDSFAGRKAKCKGCGAPVTVPVPAHRRRRDRRPRRAASAAAASPATAAPASPAPPRKIPMRQRRLTADAEQMAAAFQRLPARSASCPPRASRPRSTRSSTASAAWSGKKNQPVPREQHLVEIQLTSEYPRISPKCRMLTPIFHPNIDPATICVGDHWAAGERLVDLVIRIGEMLAYQAYNIKSPLDGEAAMWADLHQSELPTDSRGLRPANLE